MKDIAVVIGMPRAGTTWLYENLKIHPDICVSDYKEINRYLRKLSEKQYLSYFRNCDGKIGLDISPLYFFDMEVLKEISRNHSKVIIIVREQGGWIESLNNQIAKYGGDVEHMKQSQRYMFPVEGSEPLIFDYGSYRHDDYLSEIQKIFGNKLLLLNFSMLQTDPLGLLRKIESFFEIRAYFTQENLDATKINTSEQKISWLYSRLLKMSIIWHVIPFALKILPKGAVHWLRKYLVYAKR